MAGRKVPLADRFWSKVHKTESCWLWTASKDSRGYGRVSYQQIPLLAHRVAWELAHGPIPAGDHFGTLCVCHHCDTPACVNPSHLFLGTQEDNMRDRDLKGRQAPPERKKHLGSAHGMAKLSDDDVRLIREIYPQLPRSGGRVRPGYVLALSRRFGVGKDIVHDIVRRKTWTHL
jgi:hypothetical protein